MTNLFFFLLYINKCWYVSLMFIFRLSFLPYQISFKFMKTLGCVDKFFSNRQPIHTSFFFFYRENSFFLLRYANFESLLIYIKSSYDHYPYFLANILEIHSDRRKKIVHDT